MSSLNNNDQGIIRRMVVIPFESKYDTFLLKRRTVIIPFESRYSKLLKRRKVIIPFESKY